MPKNPDVELTIQALIDLGVFSDAGCKRFANMIKNLQQLSAPFERATAQPPAGAALAPVAAKRKRRRRRGRGRANIPREALEADRAAGMTVAEIAKKYRVSTPTVFARIKEYGLKGKVGRPPAAAGAAAPAVTIKKKRGRPKKKR